jgi:hypothetical protein
LFVIFSAGKSPYHTKSIHNDLFWNFLEEAASRPKQAAIKPQLVHTVRVSFFWPSLAIAASEALDPPTPQIIDFERAATLRERKHLLFPGIRK